MDKFSVLKQYFGHSEFRPGQEALIDAILSGRDALGIMPTGGGKSLCYQVPSLLLPGLTLVVSPLISLMKDQVAALKNAGVPAAYINSSLGEDQIRQVYSRAYQGSYKLLYIAPERLEGTGFSNLTREMPVSLVAVDEAHCISQWGQDFRPSYLRIARFIAELPRRPVVAAFTATATSEVREDIIRLLELNDPVCNATGVMRPNLFFDVQSPRHKMAALLALIQERENKSGIVYCATRSNVDKVCEELCAHGYAATRYHAGLSEAERRENQDDFQYDRKTVMVATNAFGMGIDKSNVSYVIHFNMPKSLEAYYQEAGRAGRDGEPADCILLYSPGDVQTAKYLIENSGGEGMDEAEQALARHRDRQRLYQMIGYCRTTKCLWGYILDYFGQQHGEGCGSCGNCRGDYETRDVTVPAQMLLSCILRVKKRLGYYVGKSLIVRTLCGSKDKRVRELGLDELSTYALMENKPRREVNALVDYLEQEGYVRINPEHSTLEETRAAADILFHGGKVTMPVRLEPAEPEPEPERFGRSRRGRTGPAPAADAPQGLVNALKAVRNEIAQRESVPAYVVFSNATLSDMAAKCPRTITEFLEVSGVGEIKAMRYGEAFLKAINEYEEVPEED